MESKKGFLVMLAISLVFVTWGIVVKAGDVPDVITIKSSIYEKHRKSPVEFTHKKHAEDYKIACTECHHVYKDGKNVWKEGDPVQKCEECHNDPTTKGLKKLPPEQQKRNLELAFHNNCVGCHKKLKKENKDTKAPTTCKQCHPKKKK